MEGAVDGANFNRRTFRNSKDFLVSERLKGKTIYPPGTKIFSAFDYTPFEKVKVVLIGQDPYHGPGQAHGLCFSVPDGVPPPPSLVNVFKELNKDLGIPIPKKGNLEKWAKQGVLLLNATLTVQANAAGSHQGKGWESFTRRRYPHVIREEKGTHFFIVGEICAVKREID